MWATPCAVARQVSNLATRLGAWRLLPWNARASIGAGGVDMTTRRTFIQRGAQGLAAGAILARTRPAAADTKVKFVLDWQIQGPQAPFIAAKTLGAFSADGLDVT